MLLKWKKPLRGNNTSLTARPHSGVHWSFNASAHSLWMGWRHSLPNCIVDSKVEQCSTFEASTEASANRTAACVSWAWDSGDWSSFRHARRQASTHAAVCKLRKRATVLPLRGWSIGSSLRHLVPGRKTLKKNNLQRGVLGQHRQVFSVLEFYSRQGVLWGFVTLQTVYMQKKLQHTRGWVITGKAWHWTFNIYKCAILVYSSSVERS